MSGLRRTRWVGESSGIEVDRRSARMAQLDPLGSKPGALAVLVRG